MAFVPAPNIMEVEIRALSAGQKIENRIMVNRLGPVTPTDLSAVATLVWDWARDSYMPLMPSTVVLNEVVATDLTTDDGSQVTHTTGTINGGQSSGAMPNEVTMCVSLRTGARGRSARGRLYLLGISRGDMHDANTIEATSAAAFLGIMDDLREQISDAGWAWTIVSYVHNKVPRPGGPVYYLVSSCVFTDLVVDSQRRRKPGVGT